MNLRPAISPARLFLVSPPRPRRWHFTLCATRNTQHATRNHHPSSGAVLLEVVLALVLFVVAASFITAGMNASVDTVERLRLNTHAVNLAVSVLAELQMGARSTETNGPAKFDLPFDKWSWELQFEPLQGEVGETNQLTRVEVIIRHAEQPIVQRLTQIMRLEEKKKGANATLTF